MKKIKNFNIFNESREIYDREYLLKNIKEISKVLSDYLHNNSDETTDNIDEMIGEYDESYEASNRDEPIQDVIEILIDNLFDQRSIEKLIFLYKRCKSDTDDILKDQIYEIFYDYTDLGNRIVIKRTRYFENDGNDSFKIILNIEDPISNMDLKEVIIRIKRLKFNYELVITEKRIEIEIVLRGC